jgi:transposase
MSIVNVTGGVDTHSDTHVAAAVDHNGGVLGVEAFPARRAGYEDLLGWLAAFGSLDRVGVEGTGSYGRGLARFLLDSAVEVVEVDRPNRQVRRRHGKSDPVDAVAAARAALSGSATGVPKHRNGPVEQMRVLLVARRSARSQRIQTLNQMRHLVLTAPEPIRVRFKDRYQRGLVTEAARMRPRPGSDPVIYVTNLVIRNLARRIQHLDTEIKDANQILIKLLESTAPSLLDLYGLGPDTAASLLVSAGDNPERLRSEAAWAHLCGSAPIPASSGKITRHRLNRRGDRHTNSALYRIVITRMSSHQPTRDYVARETYRHLPRGAIT